MESIEKYIPKEYLALKINYCRQQLEKLPIVTLQKYYPLEDNKLRVVTNNHKYTSTSETGKYYYDVFKERERLERELRVYEAIWDCYFKVEPQQDCQPVEANRIIYVDTNKPVIMNKAYFDSLKNDADDSYPKPSNYFFNGIYYRSAAERDIAIFYTEMGIPFKYEPEVYLKGLTKAVYPDFVAYLRELDNCKFHEHFGMKDYSDYQRITKIKFNNFVNAGLVPGLDILFTHDTDAITFDPRHLSAKLNAAIYGSICANKEVL